MFALSSVVQTVRERTVCTLHTQSPIQISTGDAGVLVFLHAHTQGQLDDGLTTKLEQQGKPVSVWFDLMLHLLEPSELQGDLSHIRETSVSFPLF